MVAAPALAAPALAAQLAVLRDNGVPIAATTPLAAQSAWMYGGWLLGGRVCDAAGECRVRHRGRGRGALRAVHDAHHAAPSVGRRRAGRDRQRRGDLRAVSMLRWSP